MKKWKENEALKIMSTPSLGISLFCISLGFILAKVAFNTSGMATYAVIGITTVLSFVIWYLYLSRQKKSSS